MDGMTPWRIVTRVAESFLFWAIVLIGGWILAVTHPAILIIILSWLVGAVLVAFAIGYASSNYPPDC